MLSVGDRIRVLPHGSGVNTGKTGFIYLITPFWYFVELEGTERFPNQAYKFGATDEIELVETEEEGAIKCLGEEYFYG